MYVHIPDVVIPYHLGYSLAASAAALACTMLATISACYRELGAQPAELMRPEAPKARKAGIPRKNSGDLEKSELYVEVYDKKPHAV